MTLHPTPVNDVRAALGEHPVRIAGDVLAWVDIERGDLHRLHPDGSHVAERFDEGIGAVAPASDGGLVVAAGTAFIRIDAAGGRVGAPVVVPGAPDGAFFNDGACDPAGRFLAGTSTPDRTTGAASLYSLDPDGTVRVVMVDVTESNGIAWSADGATMYYVDSGTQDLLAFDYDLEAGTVGSSRVVTTVDPAHGVPDGLAVDAEGALWLGLWDGWGIRRYTPSGELLESVPFPVQHVTCAGFGGAGLDTLYVATASSYLSEEELAAQPLAGALFRLDVPVRGLAVPAFG